MASPKILSRSAFEPVERQHQYNEFLRRFHETCMFYHTRCYRSRSPVDIATELFRCRATMMVFRSHNSSRTSQPIFFSYGADLKPLYQSLLHPRGSWTNPWFGDQDLTCSNTLPQFSAAATARFRAIRIGDVYTSDLKFFFKRRTCVVCFENHVWTVVSPGFEAPSPQE